MGKRKKLVKELEDPIIRNRKKVKKEEEQDNDVNLEGKNDQLEEELEFEDDQISEISSEEDQPVQKTQFDQFLDQFNINKNEKDKEKIKYHQSLNKVNVSFEHIDQEESQNQNEKSKRFCEIYYKKFLNLESSDLCKKYLDEVAQVVKLKQTENEKIRQQMQEIFDLNPKQQNRKQQKDLTLNVQEEYKNNPITQILQNNISIKEYKIKDNLKKRSLFYCPDIDSELLIDQNALETLQKNEKNEILIKIKQQQQLEDVQKDNDKTENQKSQKTQFISNLIEQYYDVAWVDKDEVECEQFREIYIKHILNHLQNYFEQYKKSEIQQEQQQEKQNNQEEQVGQFKGFTKNKILILTPFKGDASLIIKEIIFQNSGSKQQLKKTTFKQKFQEQFENEETQLEDDFRIGLSLGYNNQIKLFTSFENSDIIVSSPLGLRLIIGDDKENSIEIVIVDRAATILMQNWEHLELLFQNMNKIPKHNDMSSSLEEIRPYFFENLSRFYRQTIIYTEYNFPELNSLRTRYMDNYRGSFQNKLYYKFVYEEQNSKYLQEFVKIEVKGVDTEVKIQNFIKKEIIKQFKQVEERFQYFKNKIWETLRADTKLLIFCSSYYDFLKLKNYFLKINASFQAISEYTSRSKIQSKIAKCMKEKIKFILFSERAYYFEVSQIKLMNHILFYQVPKNAFIYKELIDSMEGLPNQKSKIFSFFTKFDYLSIERIVGNENCQKFFAEYNKSTSFIL